MTLIEVLVATALIGIGTLSALTTMVGSAALDEELRERSAAVRAATSRMSEVLAYDYGDDLDVFVAHWTGAAAATFDVDGLEPLAGQPSCGAVEVDDSDPERVIVTVAVRWRSRKGDRSFEMPMVVTEIRK